MYFEFKSYYRELCKNIINCIKIDKYNILLVLWRFKINVYICN